MTFPFGSWTTSVSKIPSHFWQYLKTDLETQNGNSTTPVAPYNAWNWIEDTIQYLEYKVL